MNTNIDENENENEWLQFIEFVKRKYGNNASEYIRINDYTNAKQSSYSVAQYYYQQNRTIDPNAKLSNLLRDRKFIDLLKLNNPLEVSKFTEIYNETDYLMKSLNNKQENIYIKCNPVDDNGVSVDGSYNLYGPNLSNLNSILTDGAQSFSPASLYNNVGLQVFISLIFVAISYGVGYLMFSKFPSHFISKARERPDNNA